MKFRWIECPRSARLLLIWLFAWGGGVATGVTGDVVGVHRMTLTSGPNCVSMPLHGSALVRGEIQSVAGSTMTLSSSPGWTPNALGKVDGFHQYIVVLRTDSSAAPGTLGNQGDWWPIESNGAGTLTVHTRGEALSAQISVGDEIEVRRLTTLKSVFGSGADLKLIPDTDFDVLTTQEDVIRFVQGASFSGEVFYHQGAPAETGYYYNGQRLGNGDGSSITLLPNEPMVVFRKVGSPPLSLLVGGSVLETRFSHYLTPGANAVGMVYPVPGPLLSSNLKESGWASDANFDVLAVEEDIAREIEGTSFGAEIFHHAGPVDADYGWYVNGNLEDFYPFKPTAAYMFFMSGSVTLRWRQNPAFEP